MSRPAVSKPARRQALQPEQIATVQLSVRERNSTSFIPANIRNVLFCGASRSGKTTCFKVCMDPCYSPESASIFADTEDTVYRSFSIKDETTQSVMEFIVSIIDSPGVFEVRAADSELSTRTNEAIEELIVDCLNHEVTYLNLLCLFLSLGASISVRDVEAIDLFMNLFGGCGLPVLLVITHADKYSEERRTAIENEIQQYPRLKPYFDNKQLEIMFMGCVDTKFGQPITNVPDLEDAYDNVVYWRALFLERIFSANNRVELKKTHLVKDLIGKAGQALSECLVTLEKLERLDEDVAEYKRLLYTHQKNMKFVYTNKLLLQKPDVEGGVVSAEFAAEVTANVDRLWSKLQAVQQSSFSKEKKLALTAPWKD